MGEKFNIDKILNLLKLQIRPAGSGFNANAQNFNDTFKKQNIDPNSEKELFYSISEMDKLFKLGEQLGLKRDEIIEALEKYAKSLVKYPKNADVSTLLLLTDAFKYPFEDDLKEKIPDKSMQEIKEKFPEVYEAITEPFEFICKYPKTLSIDKYKKFNYNEILEFSSKHPEEYEEITETIRQSRKNNAEEP